MRRSLEHSAYATRRSELERGLAGASDPVARRRVRHVESENERVREVVDILRSTPVDTRRLGEIFRQAHESLRVDFEVSTPELDELVHLAYGLGASAARMTGAGFGGSIVALVPAERAPRFTTEIVEAYSGAGRPGSPSRPAVRASCDDAFARACSLHRDQLDARRLAERAPVVRPMPGVENLVMRPARP